MNVPPLNLWFMPGAPVDIPDTSEWPVTVFDAAETQDAIVGVWIISFMPQGVSMSVCKGSNVPSGKVHPESQHVTKAFNVFPKKQQFWCFLSPRALRELAWAIYQEVLEKCLLPAPQVLLQVFVSSHWLLVRIPASLWTGSFVESTHWHQAPASSPWSLLAQPCYDTSVSRGESPTHQYLAFCTLNDS